MAAQLLVYGFPAGTDLSGHVLGALERLEGGGALRVADALLVARDPDTGELLAAGLEGRRLDAMVATLLEFRLDAGARRRATARVLGDGAHRALADAIAAGTALVAVLVEHVWAEALDDAVIRSRGARLGDSLVEASGLGDVADQLLVAARGLTAGTA